jgi:WD40 repeat protein
VHIITVAKKTDVGQVAFTPDGTVMCAPIEIGRLGTEVALWDIATGESRSPGPSGFTGAEFCFHPSGRWLFGGAKYEGLAVYDLTTGKSRSVPVEERSVGRVRTTPNGKAIVCYHWNRSSYARNGYARREWTATGALKSGWSVPTYSEAGAFGYGCGVEVLSDGKRFVTAENRMGSGPRLAIRSLSTGEITSSTTLDRSDNPILAVSPDDELLIAAVTTELIVYSASNLTKPLCRRRNDNRKHFTGIAFHPSGKYLAATSNDTTVKLFDTSTWAVARTFTWEIGRVRSITFSRDGTLAAAGSDSGKVVVWDVDL